MAKIKINKREALKNKQRSVSLRTRMLPNLDENQASNTLSFVFVSNDNSGLRYDWGSGEHYNERLDVTGAKFNSLITFFKNHNRTVDDAIGKISNVRVENDEVIGDVTFGSDEDSSKVYSKYKEGILTDVSIGYEIRDYRVEKGSDGAVDDVIITDFNIFEVSAVGIGFDGGAKKREKESSEMNEKEKARLAELQGKVERSDSEKQELTALLAKSEDEKTRLKDENLELKRVASVQAVCLKYGVDAEQRAKFEADKTVTADAVRTFILDSKVGDTSSAFNQKKSDDLDERSKMVDAMVDGLAMRVGAKIEKPADGADKYRYASLIAIGNALLPEDKRSLNPVETAERSLLTGDFPLLLQSVGSRVMTSEFEAITGTFKRWIKEVDVPDFRIMTDLTSTVGGGRLSKTKENGDLEELGATEKGESWKIETFGNKFVLTREMLINDDLGAFTNLLQTFAKMAKTTANGIAYDLLQLKGDYSNYKMSDGSGLYVASRKNSGTDALSSASLSKGRLAMNSHMSIDGKTPLNIVPKYLIVSPALEETARELLLSTSKVGADNVNVPNVHYNEYELVVDPEIKSETAWYLLADQRTLKMGYLAGTNRAPVTKLNESSLSRSVYEGVFDIGVMAEDYRGLYRGNV